MPPVTSPSPFTPIPASEAPFPSFTKTWYRNTYSSISPTAPQQSALGKTVIITGGGSGIGASTARAFAQAGAKRIAILGRTENKLLETKRNIEASQKDHEDSTKIRTFTVDVFDQAAVDAFYADFDSQLRADGESEGLKVDVLVLNAGYCDMNQPITGTMDVDAWIRGIRGNLVGPLVMTRGFLRYRRSEEERKSKGLSGETTIVNISSLASFMLMMPGLSAYSVGKAAGAGLMASLQLEYPELRIVSVQPGGPDSEMQRNAGVAPMDDGELLLLICDKSLLTMN